MLAEPALEEVDFMFTIFLSWTRVGELEDNSSRVVYWSYFPGGCETRVKANNYPVRSENC